MPFGGDDRQGSVQEQPRSEGVGVVAAVGDDEGPGEPHLVQQFGHGSEIVPLAPGQGECEW